MTEYELDPKVCPSSLNEDGMPMTEGETAHRWDDTTDPHTCAECGAQRDEVKCICSCGNEHMRYED